eukprot:11175024-Alexandrium_andersonii.AAC.1
MVSLLQPVTIQPCPCCVTRRCSLASASNLPRPPHQPRLCGNGEGRRPSRQPWQLRGRPCWLGAVRAPAAAEQR